MIIFYLWVLSIATPGASAATTLEHLSSQAPHDILARWQRVDAATCTASLDQAGPAKLGDVLEVHANVLRAQVLIKLWGQSASPAIFFAAHWLDFDERLERLLDSRLSSDWGTPFAQMIDREVNRLRYIITFRGVVGSKAEIVKMLDHAERDVKALATRDSVQSDELDRAMFAVFVIRGQLALLRLRLEQAAIPPRVTKQKKIETRIDRALEVFTRLKEKVR